MHDGDAFRLQQLAAEILVGARSSCPTAPSCRSCRRRTDRRRTRPPASGTSMPFAWFSIETTRSRRSWKAFTNFGMKSCGPVSASVAAHCAIVQAPDVCWPWIITIASTSGFGPGAVADAPAGHRIGLRHAVHGERALVELRLDLARSSRTARRCRAGARTCRRSGSRPAGASAARRSAPSAPSAE